MRITKNIFAVLISIILIVSSPLTACAAAKYTAAFSLTSTVGSSSTVYKTGSTIEACPGDTVYVTMHIKTTKGYYAGTLQAQVFYSTNIFTGSSKSASEIYSWNTSSSLYKQAYSCGGGPYDVLVASARQKCYPSSWSDTQKAACKFYHFTMPAGSSVTTVASSFDDDIVTFPIYISSSAKVGDTGKIFISTDSRRTAANPSGQFFLARYTSAGSILGETEIYNTTDVSFDLSKAVLNFKVVSSNIGDINNDGKTNSTDALLVLQYSTGERTLTTEQKSKADLNSDGLINSFDALKILNIAVSN